MNKFFTFISLLLILAVPSLKSQFPTDSAHVYLITASPGNETYSIFGHSAIRVENKAEGYDAVFNYGTFDFDTENFYFKFGTGRLMYFLSVADYNLFKDAYNRWGQALYLQEMNLTNKERFNLINNLRINTLEQNKYFRYDFFRDNCATRIRDIVAKSVEGRIIYDSTYVTHRESFRKLYVHCMEHQPWTYFGLNLIMGKSTDSIASLSDYMYLPEHMKNLFYTAKVVSGDTVRSLTYAPVELFPTTLEFQKPSFIFWPVSILLVVFLVVLAITLWEIKTHHYYKGIDIFFLLGTGLLGLMITWLWGWSLHIYVHNNLHIIWASPLNVLAAAALIFFSNKKWLRYYFGIYALSILLLIPVSLFTMQRLDGASYFLMGIMIIRAVRLFVKPKLSKSPNPA
jgi:hypothetical protein